MIIPFRKSEAHTIPIIFTSHKAGPSIYLLLASSLHHSIQGEHLAGTSRYVLSYTPKLNLVSPLSPVPLTLVFNALYSTQRTEKLRTMPRRKKQTGSAQINARAQLPIARTNTLRTLRWVLSHTFEVQSFGKVSPSSSRESYTRAPQPSSL